MSETYDNIIELVIILPKGKIIIIFPADTAMDNTKIEQIKKYQTATELGDSNGIPSSISLSTICGDMPQSYSTTDEFTLTINLVTNIIDCEAEHFLARTFDSRGNVVNTKVISKIIIPLKDFFACRYDTLALNPQNPDNGQIAQNELWISNSIHSYNTRNVGGIILFKEGVTIITPDDDHVLFTVIYQNGKIVAKNVCNLMIAATNLLSSYLEDAIETT